MKVKLSSFLQPAAFFLLAILLLQAGCIEVDNRFSGLPPGVWRGVLELEPKMVTPNPKGEPLPEKLGLSFEEVTNGELPFNFEVVYTDDTTFHLEIMNGEERIVVKDITIGLDRATAKDTIVINFPVYDSYLRAIYEENIMEGEWVVNNRGEAYSIPFVAQHGKGHRFTTLRKTPAADLSGKWAATFAVESKDEAPYPAVAELAQNGNYLTGTFLTETGDYRFLEGTVQDNKVYLSCFDGAHAFLFEARIQEDGSLLGSFRSGKHYRTLWTAKKDEGAALTDPDELTLLKPGYESIDFSFPGPDGKVLSLDNPRFQGKAVIVQLLGTWCPNCRDEALFLKAFLEQHPEYPLEVVGLAFERYREKDKAFNAIRRFQENLQPGYPILLAGFDDKSEAAQALPMLGQVRAFPTMIILDQEHKVQRIHTGFNGPATSAFQAFSEDFESFIADLLQ